MRYVQNSISRSQPIGFRGNSAGLKLQYLLKYSVCSTNWNGFKRKTWRVCFEVHFWSWNTNCLELIQKGKWGWGFTQLRRTQSQPWALQVPVCNTQDREVSHNFIAISSQIDSVALQLVTLPTAVVSLCSLPYKTLALFPALQPAVKGKLYVLPPTQAVKIVNSSTFLCSQWSILKALLLSLLFIFGQCKF